MDKIRQFLFPIIFFTVLFILIVLPLMSSGLILTLDIPMVPKISFPHFSSGGFLFESLLALLNLLAPSSILEKIMIFSIFFLSGVGMYFFTSKRMGFAAYFAGLFYSVNPFVYERIMAGQWYFLLGYSLFPFFIGQFIRFFDRMKTKDLIITVVILTMITTISIHFSAICIVFFFFYGVIYLLFHPEKTVPIGKKLVYFILLYLILNVNWILPAILQRSDLSDSLSMFNTQDLTAFRSVPDKNLGVIFNLVSGYGFWAEANNYFILAKDLVFIWPIISLIIIAVSIWGFWKMVKTGDRGKYPLIITLVLLFIMSLDFAGGVALSYFAVTVRKLYDFLPVLYSFREPQKLIAVVMFCYAFFGSAGLSDLANKVRGYSKYAVIIVFMILPFVYTPTVLGGFWGQLKPVSYPPSWTKANNLLNSDKDDFLTLFFPWHMYMPFRFSNYRVIANPAPYFFEKPILSSQNYETKFLYTHETRPEALHIEGLLSIQRSGYNLVGQRVYERIKWGQSLSPIGVKYIILTKDDDWRDYDFLEVQSDLEKIYENNDLILYKNLSFGKEIIPED